MNEYIKKKIIATKMIAPIIKETPQTKKSGIYLYERTDEQGITYFYAGLAVNIFNRQISHWNGFQRIDISMRKRGFKSAENPYGWEFKVLEYCPKEKLEEREKFWILENLKQGKQTYNLNYGGNEGKTNTFDKERKGYQQGVLYGELRTLRKVRVFFDKYLDYTIKGKPNKIKEKKFAEFTELLNQVTEKNSPKTDETTETE